METVAFLLKSEQLANDAAVHVDVNRFAAPATMPPLVAVIRRMFGEETLALFLPHPCTYP